MLSLSVSLSLPFVFLCVHLAESPGWRGKRAGFLAIFAGGSLKNENLCPSDSLSVSLSINWRPSSVSSSLSLTPYSLSAQSDDLFLPRRHWVELSLCRAPWSQPSLICLGFLWILHEFDLKSIRGASPKILGPIVNFHLLLLADPLELHDLVISWLCWAPRDWLGRIACRSWKLCWGHRSSPPRSVHFPSSISKLHERAVEILLNVTAVGRGPINRSSFLVKKVWSFLELNFWSLSASVVGLQNQPALCTTLTVYHQCWASSWKGLAVNCGRIAIHLLTWLVKWKGN